MRQRARSHDFTRSARLAVEERAGSPQSCVCGRGWVGPTNHLGRKEPGESHGSQMRRESRLRGTVVGGCTI